jgi:DNA-binding NarL/FixJ family response regulator
MCQANGRGGAGVVLQITPWERDALQLLAAGVADDEIAGVLGIGEGTVNSYLAYLFEKLGVTSRSEAVMAATRRGLALDRMCRTPRMSTTAHS